MLLASLLLAGQASGGVGIDQSLVALAHESSVRSLRAAREATTPQRPSAGALRFLLVHEARTGDLEAQAVVNATLEFAVRSSLRDHVAGGFHRGPDGGPPGASRFEKRLCDNALLLHAVAKACAATESLLFRDVAREIVTWSIREMRDSSGAFWASIDGVSEGRDGSYYLWSRDEIQASLGRERATEYLKTYRIDAPGVLLLEGSPFAGLDPSREVLLNRRSRRVRPATDQRIQAGWNGLMIGALATEGAILEHGADIEAARRAARAVMDSLGPTKALKRRDSEAAGLEDYAYLSEGLLDLHEATGEGRWRADATALLDTAVSRFWDLSGGDSSTRTAGKGRPLRGPRAQPIPTSRRPTV